MARWISNELLPRLVDAGQTHCRDATHLWVWLDAPSREDNLDCAVLLLEDAVVIKVHGLWKG